MNNKRKTILAIILVVLVVLIGGAAVYVAGQLSSRQAVAPNAPTSKPAANYTFVNEAGQAEVYADREAYESDRATWSDNSTQADNNDRQDNAAAAAVVAQQANNNECGSPEKPCVQQPYVQGGYDISAVQGMYCADDTVNTTGCEISSSLSQTVVYRPDGTLLGSAQSVSGYYAQAVRQSDGSYAVRYFPLSSGTTTNTTGGGGETTTYSATDPTATTTIAPTATTTIAPTATTTIAPTPTFVGSTACTAYGCVASSVITCSPDCPTECGKSASTITTCANSCGIAATKACAATTACPVAKLEGSKTAYKNESGNTAGNYTLTTEMNTVAKGQTFVYSIKLKNTGTVTANGVTIKDSLKDVADLTFIDTASGCSWNTTDKELTCSTSIAAGETKTFSFRVKAADGIANGDVISNKATITFDGGDQSEEKKDLTVDSVVGCNNTCTSDDQCASGLLCDSTSNKCRKAACLTETDCACAVAVTGTTRVTAAPTATRTVTATAAPTATVTEEVVTVATPTILPETGIFDLPGIAAFGGGLFLAVIGILLAL